MWDMWGYVWLYGAIWGYVGLYGTTDPTMDSMDLLWTFYGPPMDPYGPLMDPL